jgi:N-dimethylarginine dimethylaminohydrolase
MTDSRPPLGVLSETGRITDLLVKHASVAFADPMALAAEWRQLNFTAAPDRAAALVEYQAFLDLLAEAGTRISYLPHDPSVTIDSLYARDASIVSPAGMILASMGKPARRSEPAAQARAFAELGIPVIGAIEPPGQLEGGDLVWLDPRTVAVGSGYRTNGEGIRQVERLLAPFIDECIVVPLPHWRGPSDVFHLMSILSPVDQDLAVVYSPLMPVVFRNLLLDRGYRLVEVPDGEFESMGANVLALAPRRCVMLDGNPATRAGLEAAGADVRVYLGDEISAKGGGGPTCLTRPIRRDAPPRGPGPTDQVVR